MKAPEGAEWAMSPEHGLVSIHSSHLSSWLQAGSEGIHAATNLVLSSAVELVSVVAVLFYFFFFALMTHFNLYISSRSLATRLSRSFICLYLTQLFSLLPHGARERLRHSVQLEAWMAACLPWSSAWVLASFLMSADSLSLCQVDTMTGLSILRRC